jgi:glycerate dehydrogenase
MSSRCCWRWSPGCADYRQAVRDGRWRQASQFCLLDFPIRELAGKTLGIVGHGELGRGVARVAEAFGMRVLIAQRPGAVEEEQEGRVPLPILLPQVDVLSLHCPLTPETRGLIGAWELALMRRDADPDQHRARRAGGRSAVGRCPAPGRAGRGGRGRAESGTTRGGQPAAGARYPQSDRDSALRLGQPRVAPAAGRATGGEYRRIPERRTGASGGVMQ